MSPRPHHPRTGRPSWFERFSSGVARRSGHPFTFAVAAGAIVLWAITGPLFGFSDTWQLVVNTGTTVLTFLMVFVIQNTLNRDTMALHLKLDELIRVTAEARDSLIRAQDLPEDEIRRLDADERSALGGSRDANGER